MIENGLCDAVCPQCATFIKMQYFACINGDEDPVETQKFFDRSLFTVNCPKCGSVFEWPTVRAFEISDACHIIHKSRKGLAEIFINDFPEFYNLKNPRIVFDMNSFVEKARIFYMGLDDRIVEIVKVMATQKIMQAYGVFDCDEVFCWVSDDKKLEISFRLSDQVVNACVIEYEEYLNIFGHLYDYVEEVCTKDKDSIFIDFNWAVEFSEKHLSGKADDID